MAFQVTFVQDPDHPNARPSVDVNADSFSTYDGIYEFHRNGFGTRASFPIERVLSVVEIIDERPVAAPDQIVFTDIKISGIESAELTMANAFRDAELCADAIANTFTLSAQVKVWQEEPYGPWFWLVRVPGEGPTRALRRLGFGNKSTKTGAEVAADRALSEWIDQRDAEKRRAAHRAETEVVIDVPVEVEG